MANGRPFDLVKFQNPKTIGGGGGMSNTFLVQTNDKSLRFNRFITLLNLLLNTIWLLPW